MSLTATIKPMSQTTEPVMGTTAPMTTVQINGPLNGSRNIVHL
jgi:hypothetical protein